MHHDSKQLRWLLQLLVNRNTAPSSETQGFSLSEVLIAAVISSLFLMISLQSTLTGSQYQKFALDTSQFNRWVQSDLEPLQNEASQYNLATTTAAAAIGNTTITVDDVGNFTNADWLMFATDYDLDILSYNGSDRREAYKVTNVNAATNQITVSSGLISPYPASSVVVRVAEPLTTLSLNAPAGAVNLTLAANEDDLVKQGHITVGTDTQIYTVMDIDTGTNTVTINPGLQSAHVVGASVGYSRCLVSSKVVTVPDQSRGFANGFLSAMGGTSGTTVPLSKTSQYNVSYNFNRTMTIVGPSPFSVLRVNYAVQNSVNNAISDSFTTDIIPTAALYCS